jgi:hypothetical protein
MTVPYEKGEVGLSEEGDVIVLRRRRKNLLTRRERLVQEQTRLQDVSSILVSSRDRLLFNFDVLGPSGRCLLAAPGVQDKVALDELLTELHRLAPSLPIELAP